MAIFTGLIGNSITGRVQRSHAEERLVNGKLVVPEGFAHG